MQQAVAGEVRAWLARRKRSGRSAAAELGWTEPYLSRRLTGSVPFDVADLSALADLVGVPVETFFQVPSDNGAASKFALIWTFAKHPFQRSAAA
jgi:transcriptional regulator with XRE-family HTH domain